MKKRSSEVGQAGLIVMLVMVVLLTLGVSVASRSTSNLAQSNQEAETSRVFDVAEIGIETALSNLTAGSGEIPQIGDISGSYTISEEDGLEVVLEESQVVAVNTDGYTGTVNIEWSKKDCVDDAASIIVSIFDSTNNTARRVAFQGCGHSDGFEVSDPASDPYKFLGQISVSLTEDLVRIRPVYNESWVRVTGANLPTQYYRILSSANNTTSGETRAISVARTMPTAPAIFDYVLFSGGSITR